MFYISLHRATGQLGHGDENFQMITYQLTPKLIASLQGVKIVSAAAGFFNSLLIADDGRVFSFGSGGNGSFPSVIRHLNIISFLYLIYRNRK